jgi:hypothetical protein
MVKKHLKMRRNVCRAFPITLGLLVSVTFFLPTAYAQPDTTTLQLVCDPNPLPPEGCTTCNIVTEQAIFVASTDLVLCYDLEENPCLTVTAAEAPFSPGATINPDSEGCVKALTTDPGGVNLDAGSVLLTVTLCLDPGVEEGQCCTVSVEDVDGMCDFSGPIPPIPGPKICWPGPCVDRDPPCADLELEPIAITADICVESTCEPPPNCGDDRINWRQGETCDPPGSICGSRGNPSWTCDECCQCIYTPPEPTECGNGIVERGENCEEDEDCRNFPQEICRDCHCVPNYPGFCGDNVIQWKRGETCDPPGSDCGSRRDSTWQCDVECQCLRVRD